MVTWEKFLRKNYEAEIIMSSSIYFNLTLRFTLLLITGGGGAGGALH